MICPSVEMLEKTMETDVMTPDVIAVDAKTSAEAREFLPYLVRLD